MNKFLAALAVCVVIFSFLPAADAAETKPNADAGPDIKLIGDILFAIRTADFVQQIPEQIKQGFRQETLRNKNRLSADNLKEIDKIIDTAFTTDAMMQGITDALKKNYDGKRYHKVLDIVTSPLSLRMTLLEGEQSNPEDVSAFMTKLVTQPLPPARLALINELDESSRSSELAINIAVSTIRTMMRVTLGNCPKMLADMERKFEDRQEAYKENMRNTVRAMMVYIYRNVGDADLQEYVREYKDPDMQWFFDIVFKETNAEFHANGERIGIKLEELLRKMPNTGFSQGQCEI